jgi:hypothetical protein
MLLSALRGERERASRLQQHFVRSVELRDVHLHLRHTFHPLIFI